MRIDRLLELSCALVVAGCTVVAAYQFSEAQEQQSELHAYQSWERFLEFSVENPELSRGEFSYDQLGYEEKEKYEQFVDRYLVSAEQILLVEPDDPEWRSALVAETKRHSAYLTSEDFLPRDPVRAAVSGYCSYDENVRKLIKHSMGYGARGTAYRSNYERGDTMCQSVVPKKGVSPDA